MADKKRKYSSVLIISHKKDPDGICSAAISIRYAKKKGLNYKTLFLDYGDFENYFPALRTYHDTLILITDLGLDNSSEELVLNILASMARQGCRLVWLDHHQWHTSAIKKFLSLPNSPVLKIVKTLCASEIAQKVLMPNDSISIELAKVAHDSDFNLRQLESSQVLSDLITHIRYTLSENDEDLQKELTHISEMLAEHGISAIWDEKRNMIPDDNYRLQVKAYRKLRLKKLKGLLSKSCEQVIHGKLVRIVFIPEGITTTDVANYLSDANNLKDPSGKQLAVADVLITIGKSGLIGVRRTSEDILCNEIAKLFDGGGHEYAAGGEYVSLNDFESACADILHELNKTKVWIKSA